MFDKVAQKTFIDVSEEGVEAAAATFVRKYSTQILEVCGNFFFSYSCTGKRSSGQSEELHRQSSIYLLY